MVKTLFVGTSEFAVPILKKLIELDYIDLIGVVTQPDKPVGRKQVLTPTPIKEFLQESEPNIKIFQPEKLRSTAQEILDETNPELIIVASYGQMIPNEMLEFPRFKCLNIHASLLPKLRGAVPMPMAILQGFTTTGVTLQIMAEKMDVGDIIESVEYKIEKDDSTASMTEKLSNLSAEMLETSLKKWINGEIEAIKQDDSKATYCYKTDMTKESAEVKNKMSSMQIDRMVRAFYPWPIAWGKIKDVDTDKKSEGVEANREFKNKVFKIYEGEVLNLDYPNKKGLKLFRFGKKLLLRCDVGWYEITSCQIEGKKRMSGTDYLFLAEDTTVRARGIIINEDKALLIKRKKAGQEFYSLPGGSVAVGETQEQAVRREVKEETNLNIEVKEKVFDYLSLDGISMHNVYLCEVIDGNFDTYMNGEENQYNKHENSYELEWVEKSKLKEIDAPKTLIKYLEGQL